ncbi:FimV family protein [Methylomonas koyamae]|uniref:type IV pilus assembly protein FimV n=1 Tax=Methylomonas koyamae TaxID=702114 RepID=UPI001129625A|nr:hypothetical protein [Methylomonas koyamae]TPQ26028.1 hypothetical protein C2U68_12825 [Methylomonas koyamae]
MAVFHSTLIVDKQADPKPDSDFWLDGELGSFGCESSAESALRVLSVKVRRNPLDLLAHLRRIHFCFRNRLPAALYGALLDLLLVLEGKGEALARRLLNACRSGLDKRHCHILFELGRHDPQQIGNRYSLFTGGLQGRSKLVLQIEAPIAPSHDPLTLASDFIEYSQLDQAMDVLESAVGVDPERTELQRALLELYRSTGSRERFEHARRSFAELAIPLADDWQALADIFQRQAS